MTADPALPEAYRATCYRVHTPHGGLQLRIDQADAGMARLLREAGVTTAALLTAWNPRSTPATPAANQRAQDALERELERGGYPLIKGINEPIEAAARAAWTEPSVLALGIGHEAAHALALRYGQRAFVWIETDGTPRLRDAAV